MANPNDIVVEINPEQEITAAPRVEELTGVQRTGRTLAIIVLIMMSSYIVFLFILFWTKEFDGTAKMFEAIKENPSDSNFTRKVEIIRQIGDEKTKFREFVTQTTQLVLLNLLLPVLTAVLGYIFGKRETSARST